jgi:CRP-like cAMP-binding protein
MTVERLDSHELFQHLRPDQIKAISEAAEVVHHQAGDTIYYMGAKASHFFVVLDGQVSLRMPGKAGVSIQIDEATPGDMFGSCVCFGLVNYALTAQCTKDSRLLRIEAAVLKELMDEDLMMGYVIQTQISAIYFTRYVETMKKLQAIVMNLPIETA